MSQLDLAFQFSRSKADKTSGNTSDQPDPPADWHRTLPRGANGNAIQDLNLASGWDSQARMQSGACASGSGSGSSLHHDGLASSSTRTSTSAGTLDMDISLDSPFLLPPFNLHQGSDDVLPLSFRAISVAESNLSFEPSRKAAPTASSSSSTFSQLDLLPDHGCVPPTGSTSPDPSFEMETVCSTDASPALSPDAMTILKPEPGQAQGAGAGTSTNWYQSHVQPQSRRRPRNDTPHSPSQKAAAATAATAQSHFSSSSASLVNRTTGVNARPNEGPATLWPNVFSNFRCERLSNHYNIHRMSTSGTPSAHAGRWSTKKQAYSRSNGSSNSGSGNGSKASTPTPHPACGLRSLSPTNRTSSLAERPKGSRCAIKAFLDQRSTALAPALAPAAYTAVLDTNATAAASKKRYPCDLEGCNKTFSTSGHAARHKRIHQSSKPYVCTFPGCDRRFSRQDNSLQHYQIHTRLPTRSPTASGSGSGSGSNGGNGGNDESSPSASASGSGSALHTRKVAKKVQGGEASHRRPERYWGEGQGGDAERERERERQEEGEDEARAVGRSDSVSVSSPSPGSRSGSRSRSRARSVPVTVPGPAGTPAQTRGADLAQHALMEGKAIAIMRSVLDTRGQRCGEVVERTVGKPRVGKVKPGLSRGAVGSAAGRGGRSARGGKERDGVGQGAGAVRRPSASGAGPGAGTGARAE